ncbi:MAG: T9SS type A sorting domain-containing protein [Candidatus Aenigmatarchaeota archaeon]
MLILLLLFQAFSFLYKVPESEINKIVAFSCVGGEKEKVFIFLYEENAKTLSYLDDNNNQVVIADSVSDWTWAVGRNKIYIVYLIYEPPIIMDREIEMSEDKKIERNTKAGYVRSITPDERFYSVFNTWYSLLIVRNEVDSIKIKDVKARRGFKKNDLYIFLRWYFYLNENAYFVEYFVVKDSVMIKNERLRMEGEILDSFYSDNLMVLVKEDKLMLKIITENKVNKIEFEGADDGEFGVLYDYNYNTYRCLIITRSDWETKIYIYETPDNVRLIGKIEGKWRYGGICTRGIVLWNEKAVILLDVVLNVSGVSKENYKNASKNYGIVVREYLFIEEDVIVDVYNVVGQKLTVPVIKKGSETVLDCRMLPSGVYIALVRTNNKDLKFIKFIKVK